MNIFDWRKPARPNHISNKYSVSAYSTDTRTEMKGEIKDMLPPDLLQSELTKTIMADVTTKKAGKIENGSDTWIMGMFSTMFNAISKRLIGRAESGPYYGVVDKETLSFWRSSKTENKNIGAQDTSYTVSIDMNGDHKSPVAACEDKLNSIRHLLSSKSVPIAPKQNTYRSRRPKKVFVESSSVEDHFEDAFAPEDFISHPNIDCISYIIPNRIQDLEYFEVDTPKMRVETGQVSENGSIAKASPEIHKSLSKEKNLNVSKTIINLENKSNLLVEPEKTEIVVHIDAVGVDTMALEKKETVMSCEEKMLKLKTMLQERCKKNTKATLNLSDSNVESVTVRSIETKGPPKMVPTNKCKDKRYKNPNRLSKDKRKKCGIRRAIQEDMHSDETFNDDASSLENSPTITQINHSIENLASSVEHDDYFDEVAGRFIPNTGAENDDSFQVVFTDIPQIKRNWRPSDCESEDSFIVFEESPDSCYTSNDVFGDDTDSEAEYSDSEVSDSGCGLDEVRTLCLDSISKSVSDLTDDSLYVERALVDEVDCAVRICEEIPSSDIAEVCDLSEQESTSMSVLLNDTKKLLRKNQPPKKVHFSEKPPKVHVLRVWAFAARQARPGHWERYAIDRERFKRRIADADMALSWVLKPQHRSRVMFQRFMPWWNKQKRIELAEKKQREEEEKKKQAEEEKRRLEEERLRKELEISTDGIVHTATGANVELTKESEVLDLKNKSNNNLKVVIKTDIKNESNNEEIRIDPKIERKSDLNEEITSDSKTKNTEDLKSNLNTKATPVSLINKTNNTKSLINRKDSDTNVDVKIELGRANNIENLNQQIITNDDLRYKQIVQVNDKLVESKLINAKLPIT